MHEIPKLDKKGLRDFGLLTGVIFVALFGLLLPWLRGHGLPRWPWGVSATLWFLAILAPTLLRPVYQVWMRIGLVLGWINTRIILGIVFYGLLLPMGLIMRFSRDPMERKLDGNEPTYRKPSTPRTRESMEKPF